MSRVDVTLGGNNAGFKKMLAESRTEAKRFGSGMMSALNLGNAMSAANLGSSLISGVQSVVSSVMDEFDKIGSRALTLNIDPSKLQQLGMVAKLSNADVEKLAAGMSKTKIAAEKASAGSESMALQFRALGINVAEFQKLDTEGQFLAIAEAYKKSGGSAEAYTAVIGVMGRQARDLVPMLHLGADGIREMAAEMSAADAADFRAIEEFNDQLDVMQNELKISAAEGLPVFFAVMTTGWNAISMILRVVARAIHSTVGAVLPFFSSSLSWSEKFALSIQNVKDSNQAMMDGIKEDAADIGKAWDDAGGGAEKLTEKLRTAQKESVAAAELHAKTRAKEAVAEERAEKAAETARVREMKAEQDAAKAKEDLHRKVVKKRAELAILGARASGNDAEAKRLERQLKLWEAMNTNQSEFNITRAKGLQLAQQEMSLEDKITAMKKAQADLLTAKKAESAALGKDRDGLTALSESLTGGVDSLQSIGLGVGGKRYGESKEVVEIKKMAVVRNTLLRSIDEGIKSLELDIADAEF